MVAVCIIYMYTCAHIYVHLSVFVSREFNYWNIFMMATLKSVSDNSINLVLGSVNYLFLFKFSFCWFLVWWYERKFVRASWFYSNLSLSLSLLKLAVTLFRFSTWVLWAMIHKVQNCCSVILMSLVYLDHWLSHWFLIFERAERISLTQALCFSWWSSGIVRLLTYPPHYQDDSWMG